MAVELPQGPFGTITADPPWRYVYPSRKTETPGTGWHGAVENHYPTMTLQAIKDLPVASVASENAVLWLWVVTPMLPRCLEVVEAWGFQYRGMLTWVKTSRKDPSKPFFGMGYWLRGATEHAILAVRGKPKPLRRDVPTYISAPPTRHSEKPEVAVDLFESFSPGPRLEMFARRERPGWANWGNEIRDPAA